MITLLLGLQMEIQRSSAEAGLVLCPSQFHGGSVFEGSTLKTVASVAEVQTLLFESARFLVMVGVSLFLAYLVFMVAAILVSTLRSVLRSDPVVRGDALPYRGNHRSHIDAHA